MKTLRSRRIKVLLSATASFALVIAVVALAVAARPGRGANGSSQTANVQAAVARAEDVYEAMFAPPPARPLANTALEDNAKITPLATLDRTGRHALVTSAQQTTIETRGMAALAQVYTPAMVRSRYRILSGVVGTLSSGQDLLGGGGASVVKYTSESIGQATATVTASVRQWTRIGYVNPQTGKVHWQINRATVIVTDKLKRTASGTWLVSARTWHYAPGQGP